jgi:hypothetical protein
VVLMIKAEMRTFDLMAAASKSNRGSNVVYRSGSNEVTALTAWTASALWLAAALTALKASRLSAVCSIGICPTNRRYSLGNR